MDVLFHLKKEEFVKHVDGTQGLSRDPMANICRYIVEQRSFYPLFPPPKEFAAEVNLDISHGEHLNISEMPDILVVPSMLKHFHKRVGQTEVINPSFASRGQTLGTFGDVSVDSNGVVSVDMCKL